jgi:hypothetical protein
MKLKPVTDEQVFYDKFLCDKFYLPSERVYICGKFYITSFHVKSFIYWCERVYSPLVNHIKCSDYLASMLAFEQVHLS